MDRWPDRGVRLPSAPKGPEGPPRASERQARLTLTLLAASFVVLMIGLVVFFTVRTLRQRDQATDVPVIASPSVTTPEDAARVVGGIGPPAGVELGAYLESRRAALAAADGDRIAVVSLAKYTTEARAKATVAGAEVLGLLAAAPGGQPALVTTDVATWAREQTAEVRAERDEIEKLIPTAANDPSFQAFYRRELQRLDQVIASLKPDGELVFGVVVKAPVPALQQAATKPEVRLVDVGPSAEAAPKPSYRGLRPEEVTRANEPNTRP